MCKVDPVDHRAEAFFLINISTRINDNFCVNISIITDGTKYIVISRNDDGSISQTSCSHDIMPCRYKIDCKLKKFTEQINAP